MVSTDTRGCVSYMGHRSVALTWSSVVDDRPDRSSRTGRRHRRNVWCECSSKSTHCSKVHGSYHPRTIGLGSFTRRPVWTRRASHPAPSGRPPRGGAKVTWFRYSCEYLGILEKTPGNSSPSPEARFRTTRRDQAEFQFAGLKIRLRQPRPRSSTRGSPGWMFGKRCGANPAWIPCGRRG